MKKFNQKCDYKLVLKIIITSILCGFGLIYQSSQLITEFMTGKTLVQITIGRVFNETLPAITVCVPYFISLERLAEIDPNINNQFKEFKQLFLKLQDNNSDEIIIKLNKAFGPMKDDSIKHLISMKSWDLLDNFTIEQDYWNNKTEQVHRNMGYEFKGYQKQMVQQMFIEAREKAIESYLFTSFGGNRNYKCFTYFSHLHVYWRKFKMVMFWQKFLFNHFMHWTAPIDLPKILFSIHSPNDMPRFSLDESKVEFETNTEFEVTFSQLSIERMGNGYDTNCREYDLDHKFAYSITRYDCVLSCFLKKTKEKIELDNLFFSEYPLRKEYFDPDKTIPENFRPAENVDGLKFEETKVKSSLECLDHCQENCITRIYPFHFSKSKLEMSPGSRYTRIIIKHNGLPDIYVKHLPEITFIAFICNFGGLLGMWLGLSIWAVFDDITKRFTYLVYKIGDTSQTNNSRTKVETFSNTNQHRHFRMRYQDNA